MIASPKPSKGERQKRLLDEGSLAQAREERLQDLWASKLREELVESKAPVIDGKPGPGESRSFWAERPGEHAQEICHHLWPLEDMAARG